MMNNSFLYTVIIFFLTLMSCNNQSANDVDNDNPEVTVDLLKGEIKEMDDSLNMLFEKRLGDNNFKIDRLVYHEGINRCIKFYETFPKDEYAPFALEKAAGLYDALLIPQKAADWRDTLITSYPNYDRMVFILEQQKAHYDNFDAYVPDKIKLYINKMLAIDSLSTEKREQLEFRLENIDLKFIDIVRLRNPDLEM